MPYSHRANFAVYCRSAVLSLVMTTLTLVIAPCLLLVSHRPFATRYRLAQWWVLGVMWTLEHVCGLRYRLTGQEHIPLDRNGIICCKHQSAWETIALQKIFPPQVFLLKQELLRMPFWGWAMATLNPIAIDRSQRKAALNALLEQGTARLRDGLWVVIFPEGTRVAPGQQGKFNAGASMLAERSGYPIVPVAHNAGEYWGRNSFLKFPGVIDIRIGPPIDPQGKTASEIQKLAEDWIRETMLAIERDAIATIDA